MKGRIAGWFAGAALAALSVAGLGTSQALALATTQTSDVHALTLHNLHTNETATIIFKRNGVYDQDGLGALDKFLRDPIDLKSVTNMDPHLFDLLWDVYQQAGSDATIQVLDGYRSPKTNAYLRSTSDGVAENSLHMKGEAIDFYIPGVPLPTIRNIGLKEQAGGVGFYPDSGSPFVHLDTGSVRHWPLMSRQQLMAVFPDGKSIDIPADGDPLPGYKQALAAYNQRQAQLTPVTQVASFTADGQPKSGGMFGKFAQGIIGGTSSTPAPVVVAAAQAPQQPQAASQASQQPVGVAVATYTPDAVVTPKPNLAPRAPSPITVASLAPTPKIAPSVAPATASIAPPTPRTAQAAASPRAADFASPDFWNAPQVPAVLASAMASRGRREPGSSLPIAPTAVVATVSVNRAIDAGAVTSAVFRDEQASVVPAVLAYADAPPVAGPATGNVPKPRNAPVTGQPLASAPHAVLATPPPPLTLTALDTQGLRLWMAQNSTRQRTYALLTMPDFAPTAALMSAPSAAAGAFGGNPAALRTDRFAPVDAR